MLEKSLAAVVRVPREQPRIEIMPNDEPDTTSSGKNLKSSGNFRSMGYKDFIKRKAFK